MWSYEKSGQVSRMHKFIFHMQLVRLDSQNTIIFMYKYKSGVTDSKWSRTTIVSPEHLLYFAPMQNVLAISLLFGLRHELVRH